MRDFNQLFFALRSIQSRRLWAKGGWRNGLFRYLAKNCASAPEITAAVHVLFGADVPRRVRVGPGYNSRQPGVVGGDARHDGWLRSLERLYISNCFRMPRSHARFSSRSGYTGKFRFKRWTAQLAPRAIPANGMPCERSECHVPFWKGAATCGARDHVMPSHPRDWLEQLVASDAVHRLPWNRCRIAALVKRERTAHL